MLEEDIDDTHLCIKCSTTIVGIENYVQHRKNSCSSKTNRDIVHVDHPYGTYDFSETSTYHHHDHHKSEEVEKPGKSLSESYDLGADVFFSSLELQSSSKRTLPTSTATVSSANNPITNSGGSGNVNVTSNGGGGGKNSSSASSSRILTRKATAALLSHHEPEDEWIEQTSSTSNNNSHNLMISGNKKCEPPSSVFTFNNDSPEPETEDEDDVDDEDYETTSPSVPANHTGGKWKPTDNNGGNLRQHHDHHTLLRNSPSSAWDDRHHTWDNITDTVDEKSGKIQEIQEDFDHDFNPPPGHTKGKWVPGTKIVKLDYKEEVEIERIYTRQYWCNTCNRKLASKILYERHLKSNLHLKRSEPEQQLERAAVKMVMLPERIKKPSKYLNPSIYVTSSNKSDISEKKSKTTIISEKSSKRKRRKYFIKCETCKTRLPKYLLGKHLISHYHYRRMIQSSSKSYDIILENMDRIVKQAPYQCQPCQFYTNTENDFLWHWNTPNHRDITEGPGRFWCSFCKFECEDNNQMRRHLLSIEHKEVLLAINRSVPIIIGKKIIIECFKCKQIFRYNFELRKHAEHCTAEPSGTASNNYQSKFNCNLCDVICKSRLSLQKHQFLKHKIKNFYCSICNKNFETSEKSKKHRSSVEHKISAASSRKNKILIRKCKICNETLQDILKLKEHMTLKHPESKSLCPHCGKTFALPQEVGRHIRDMQCNQSKRLHLSGLLETDETTSVPPTPCLTTPSPSLNTALSRPLFLSAPSTTTSNISSSSSLTNPEPSPPYLSTMSLAPSKTVLSTTNSLFLTIPSTCSTVLNPPILSTVNSPLFLTISSTPLTRQDIAHGTVISSPIVVEHITKTEKLYSSTNLSKNDNNKSNDIPKGTQTENDKMLSCSKCDYRTTMKSELLYHEIFHKQENLDSNKKLKISCPLCEKTFRKHSLRCHLRQHTNEKIFICNYCQMSFGRKHNLKTHIINRHETDKKQQKQQKKKKDLNNKIQAKYQCDTCGKFFKQRYSLQQHISIHGERDKRFSCPMELCIFIGRNASDLKTHLSVHSMEKNFKCIYDGCDYMGKTMGLLKKHSKKHESNNKILSCPECNFTAKIPGHMKRHMRIHTGEKPYKCPHCSYSCNNSENLRKHVLLTALHAGKCLYECEFCDAEQQFKTNFQREYHAHLIIAHKIEVEKFKKIK